MQTKQNRPPEQKAISHLRKTAGVLGCGEFGIQPRATGSPRPKARPLMSSAMAALVRRIDAALDLEPGHGLCDVAMHDIIEDLRAGDFSFVLDGWALENPEKTKAALLSIFPQAKEEQA